MNYDTRLESFKELIRKIEYLKYTTNSLVYWDKITYMPRGSIEYRSKVMAFMANEQYKLLTSPEFIEHVRYFDNNKQNSEITNAMLKRIHRNSYFMASIPEQEYSEYIELIAKSEQIWAKAKKNNNFEMFEPYLEKIFDCFRRFSSYFGYENNPYDSLMDYYEEGLRVDGIDTMASELKSFLLPAIEKIKQCDNTPSALTEIVANRTVQERLWNTVLKSIGFDFNFGRVDLGSHTTVLTNSPMDVRIVSSYEDTDLFNSLSNILHSGGKGVYQQAIDKKLMATFLAETPSFAMEESLGLFYENNIGKSKAFFRFFSDKVSKNIPELKDITPEELYMHSCEVKPSLIRNRADEVTFLLHILIRYELEKEIICGNLKVSDLKEAWNQKYTKYLGICPKSDSEGILQDIHWAAGYVGYFPTYLVSTLLASQIRSKLEEDMGDIDTIVSSGDFCDINAWLSEHIFKYGATYSTMELIKKATEHPLGSSHHIRYLRDKYSDRYKVDL